MVIFLFVCPKISLFLMLQIAEETRPDYRDRGEKGEENPPCLDNQSEFRVIVCSTLALLLHGY